jgi:hypothetical protein
MNPGVSPDDTSSADALAQMAAMFFIGGTASALPARSWASSPTTWASIRSSPAPT